MHQSLLYLYSNFQISFAETKQIGADSGYSHRQDAGHNAVNQVGSSSTYIGHQCQNIGTGHHIAANIG